MVPPNVGHASPSDLESLTEMRDVFAAKEKFDQKRSSELGKVGQMLGASVKVSDWTFPFLTFQDRQLSVSEWYPELLIVVDKFFSFGPDEEKIVAFKQGAFKKNMVSGKSVQYGYLTPSMDLSDLAGQLELMD